MVDTYVVMNVVLLILSYTKEKDAIIFTHPPAVSSIFISIFWSWILIVDRSPPTSAEDAAVKYLCGKILYCCQSWTMFKNFPTLQFLKSHTIFCCKWSPFYSPPFLSGSSFSSLYVVLLKSLNRVIQFFVIHHVDLFSCSLLWYTMLSSCFVLYLLPIFIECLSTSVWCYNSQTVYVVNIREIKTTFEITETARCSTILLLDHNYKCPWLFSYL